MEGMPGELAREIGRCQLPVADSAIVGQFILDYQNDTLILVTPTGEVLPALPGRIHRLAAKQPFTRAVAPARDGLVIDATAGLGGDSLMLAQIAARVIAIEEHPVVCALLHGVLDAARRQGYPGAESVTVHCGDAADLLPRLPPADVIYLDPMFPPKRRQSALPPKPVRILRQLVGEGTDAGRLLAIARWHAKRRIVVKRPLHAPPLADDAVAVHHGKVVRYEVYLPQGATS